MSRARQLGAVVRLAGLRRARLAVAVALGSLTVLGALGLLGLSAYLICRAAQQPPILSLTTVIVVVRALAIAGPLARYGDRLVSHDLAFRGLGRLRTAIFAQIEPLAPGELDAYRDGELLDRMVHDVDRVQDLVLRVALPGAVALVVAPVVIIAQLVVLPTAGLALALGLGLALVLSPWLAHRLTRRAQQLQGERRAVLTAELVEALDAAEELWLTGSEGAVLDRIGAADRDLVSAGRADARGAGWADAVVVAAAGATGVAVLVLAAAAAAGGGLDPLLVAPLALVAAATFDVVGPVTAGARSIDAVSASARRLLDLVDVEPEVVDPVHPVAGPPARPAVRLRDLAVERGPAGHRELVVEHLDLDLAPGGHVVVTGPSGAGKSTLLLVLARFLERRSGQAEIGGRDLRAYAQDDVRRRVLLLAQDAHVFDSTIRENLLLARPTATPDQLEAALAGAELDAFVASLPDGLDTRVGLNGHRLSGGQRQRLALARAFLSDADVLLVDEPTAHLDRATGAAVLDELAALAHDRSVLLVTHGDAGPFAGAPRLDLSRPPGAPSGHW